jgi:hypothetical protein
MERPGAFQEVLLIRSTSFVAEELSRKDDSRQAHHLFENERLEEACWNGMVQTRLPEIFSEGPDGKGLFLWQIQEAQSFLVLELGDAPSGADWYSSIVPYLFLGTQKFS